MNCFVIKSPYIHNVIKPLAIHPLSTEKPPHNKITKSSPIIGIVPNKFVITVAPHKLI